MARVFLINLVLLNLKAAVLHYECGRFPGGAGPQGVGAFSATDS